MSTGTWVVEFRGEKCLTLNEERSKSPFVRARFTRKWREAFGDLARIARLPRGLTEVEIEVDVVQGPGSVLADIGAHWPGVKAGVDGLVDAGVMADDSPKYLRRVVLNPPARGKTPCLRLTVRGTRPCKATTEETT